jgi:Spy/CpxP family protein refolding chaperone
MFIKRIVVATSLTACIMASGIPALAAAATDGPKTVSPLKSRLSLNSVTMRNRHFSCPVTMSMPVTPMMINAAFQRMKLATDTQKKIFEIMEVSENKIAKLLADSKPSQDMLNALRSAPFDKDRYEQASNNAVKQEQAILSERTSMWAQVMSILTAEQQKELWNSTVRQPSSKPLPTAPAIKTAPPVMPPKK